MTRRRAEPYPRLADTTSANKGRRSRVGLEEFEDQESARRLQRLVEQEIVLDLQLQGFDISTPEWRVFASALAEYGYSVFKGWMIS